MDTTEQSKSPLVSVLVPVCNVEAYIARCARSVLGQTYSNLEFIFVDDGCTDSSIDILKAIIDESSRHQNKCTIIHHDQNKGLAAARNTAMDNCHGDFVFHVDSDDWVEPDAIKLLVNKQQETGADIVYTRGYYKHDKDTMRVDCHGWSNDKDSTLANILQDKATICVWSKLIKRNLYTDNTIECDEQGSFYEDYQLLTRLVYYSRKMACLDAFIYHYDRSNPISICSNIAKSIDIQKQGLRSILAVRDFFQDKGQRYLELVNRFYLCYANNMLNTNFYQRNKNGFDEFLQLIKKTDRKDWHVIGWDKPFKKMKESHYHLRTLFLFIRRVQRKVKQAYRSPLFASSYKSRIRAGILCHWLLC